MKIRPVDESEYGLYVWQMPDGSVVGDDDGHFLSIASEEGNLLKIGALRRAVNSFGVEEGQPLFLPGRRKVTDEEYEEQKARMEAGLIPDEYDAGAWREEYQSNRD